MLVEALVLLIIKQFANILKTMQDFRTSRYTATETLIIFLTEAPENVLNDFVTRQ